MAYEIPLFAHTLVAGEDLSSKQYYWVKLNSSGQVVACAAVTDRPIGILQNDPTSGDMAVVMHAGISKLSADATLTPGEEVGTSADGQGATKVSGTNTTHYTVGTVLLGADAGEYATVLFSCLAPGRAA